MSHKRVVRRRWMWLIGSVVATSLLAIVFNSVDWARVWQEVRRVHFGWLALAVAFNLSIIALWTKQWSVFLPRKQKVGYRTMFETVALMAMVSNALPYMIGQASGVLLLAKRGKVGHAIGLSVLALDQLAEGLAKLSVLAVVALLIPIPPWLRQGILLLVSVVLTLLVTLLWFAHRHREPTKPLDHAKASLLRRILHFGSRWAHHLEALRSVKVFGAGLGLALAMKAAEAAAILAVQQSFGIALPLWSVLLVLISVGIVTMVGVVPGNLGVYEATVFFVYQYVGASPEQALGLAVIQHVCYLIPLAGTGYLFVVAQNFRRRKDQSLGRSRLAEDT